MLRLFTEPFKVWADITTNPDTGHYVGIDVFKAVSFVVGVALIIDAQLHGRSVEPGMTLLFMSFGFQNSKLVAKFFDRKTADGNGNPLIQKGTESAPADAVIPVATKADEAQEIAEAI